MTTPHGLRVMSRSYKSRDEMERSMAEFLSQGWVVQTSSTTTSRRMIGCIFGLIGYWVLPKKTVYHVTYVLPPSVPLPPDPPAPHAGSTG